MKDYLERVEVLNGCSAINKLSYANGNCSGRNVGQASGLPVNRASGRCSGDPMGTESETP